MKEWISRQLEVEPEQLGRKVTTFHALGRGIIEELVRSDPDFVRLWINLLVLHPKADIHVEAFDTKTDNERYLSVRRRKGSATIGTLASIYVKSLQEQTEVLGSGVSGVIPYVSELDLVVKESSGLV